MSLLLPGAPKKSIYDILSTHNLLAEQSLFVNMGYWREARTYDDACAALAHRLLAAVAPTRDDCLLDVGCGFGDAALYWAEHFAPRHIVALGHNEAQLRIARERVRASAWASSLSLARGDATRLAFGPASFAGVLALESAFHFRTREDFFREAWRVLVPGGWLALADLAPHRDSAAWTRFQKILFRFGGAFWQFPKENLYPTPTYLQKLTDAGFVNIRHENISGHVFAGFKAYCLRRLTHPEIVHRVNPLLRLIWKTRARSRAKEGLDYLLVFAQKGK